MIPIVYTVSEDAFSAVPQTFREGSVAMGASSWQTASRVVLPAAMPGVLAACVLGFGRAIGETMIVLMASGNAAILSCSPVDSVRTFSATIAAELGEVVQGSPHYHVLFFIGALPLHPDIRHQPVRSLVGGAASEEASGSGLSPMLERTRIGGVLLQTLTALACLIIVAMVVVIFGNIFIMAWQRCPGNFSPEPPRPA